MDCWELRWRGCGELRKDVRRDKTAFIGRVVATRRHALRSAGMSRQRSALSGRVSVCRSRVVCNLRTGSSVQTPSLVSLPADSKHLTILQKRSLYYTWLTRRLQAMKLAQMLIIALLCMAAMSCVPALAFSGGATPSGKAEITTNSILIFVLLFTVAASLAAAETAITTLWPWKVRQLASEEGETSMFAVLESNLTRFLTTILIATTVSTIFTTALATELATAVFGGTANIVAYVTGGLTIFFLFFGEILPKSLAVHNAERVLRLLLPFVNTLSVILYPVGKILAFSANLILRVLNLYREEDAPVTEQELRMIIAGADRSGSIEPYESKLISNVLDLEEIDVRDVMCPRVDMVALPVQATLREFLETEAQHHFSRVPVYKDSIDNIVGVLHAKTLLRYLDDPDKLDTTTVEELADSPYFAPESVSAWSVLEQMRLRRLHIAVVVDEYGGTAGLVTLEDILEEVVGEIYDEDDDYESDTAHVVELPDGVYFVDGQAELEKIALTLNMAVTENDLEDHDTISGFICNRMEGIPRAGEILTIGNVEFKIVTADDRRILTLQARPTENKGGNGVSMDVQQKDAEVSTTVEDNKSNNG
eukprot:Plantae.Rhodophyta-Purpureofilum_apyrenoidigerum.ctg8061.p1 GENE.Plantae.Rhodophyta-Purpureofilum_apyrenoidigerum.ctg8061~~Plantae.Rhodophyta-Purpureofilum_apyrenoidigerum.ctg8061.p1  ORF type:complete len:593 (+),score=122.34 Plantae.Rhodophyta-Purpureofilum_apyrenoidigerum.ctg8061:389-2167(+)